MLKKATLFLVVFFIAANVASAQSRQMQKLETQVEIEYAKFVDESKSTRLADVVSLTDFSKYVENGVRQKAISNYELSGFIVQENGMHQFANGVIAYRLNEKTGFYEDVSKVNVFTAKFVSAADTAVTLSLQYNGLPRQITVADDSARVFSLEWLDPRYKNSNIYLAVRLVKAERLPTPCSISEIADDIINKNLSAKCYEAGSPELKSSK